MRRNVGRHADGDAARSVDDEVGNARGQHGGLERGLVVVGREVDGLHVDVGEQLAGDAHHAALGVTHGRGRIAIDGAEVALAVDQGIAQGEGLRQAHQGVVDGGVAVGMVDAHALADDLGALGVLLVVLKAHLAHGVEDAAMHGLEAVADVGQRAADDDRHGVVEIRPAHLLFDIDGNEARAVAGWRTAIERELGILIVCHRGFRSPPKRRQKGTGNAGPGFAGYRFILPFRTRDSARRIRLFNPLFSLNLRATKSSVIKGSEMAVNAARFRRILTSMRV